VKREPERYLEAERASLLRDIHRVVADPRIIEAFRTVPRELFVPEHLQGHAYDDRPLPLLDAQTISQPTMVAIMLDALNGTRKYVVSGDAATTLRWPNSELLHGDVAVEVAALKQRSDANLVIMGSGVLIHALAKAGVVDEYVLMVAPIVLGEGRRLFGPGVRRSLRLLDCVQASTGALVITYAA
jgi:dihydrofolate reductase